MFPMKQIAQMGVRLYRKNQLYIGKTPISDTPNIQWIGFVGKIFTGNQSYFPIIHMGLSGVNFPVKSNPLKYG